VKLEAKELLQVERAARGATASEAETMLREEIERRSQQYLTLHREHLELQARMDAQLAEHATLMDSHENDAAAAHEKVSAEGLRAKTAERAAEKLRNKLQV
jgi:hypothetical protein